MGQWGIISFAGDNVMDCVDSHCGNNKNISQKEANAMLKDWEGWEDLEKHGIVILLLTQGLKVPVTKLKEVLKIAFYRKREDVINEEGWTEAENREKMVQREICIIEDAITNKGQGKKTTALVNLDEKLDIAERVKIARRREVCPICQKDLNGVAEILGTSVMDFHLKSHMNEDNDALCEAVIKSGKSKKKVLKHIVDLAKKRKKNLEIINGIDE